MLPLGEWLLDRAFADAAQWPQIGLAMNVSQVQFGNRDFLAQIRQTLRRGRFDPARLELELTEGALMKDADRSRAALRAVRELGVRVALDDFGVGFSSLIYMRRFPINTIKIDRGFLGSVEGSGERLTLLESTVQLSHSLGLNVTAEGVETEAQFDLLRQIGCEQYQGFLLARPMPANDITNLIARLAKRKRVEWRSVA